MLITESDKIRFEAKFIRGDEDDCWEWRAFKKPNGYGQFYINETGCWGLGAHVVSYWMYVGIVPKGIFVLHHCDNPGCVNPKHLFLGTHKDNMSDRSLKNRQPKGDHHGRHVLTESDVKEIRIDLEEKILWQHEIAEKYGVHFATISAIKKGNSWSHVK